MNAWESSKHTLLTLQRKYILKFSTDGAVLCNKKNGVQGTMRLIEVNDEGKAVPGKFSSLPDHLQKEICLYYYIGKYFTHIICTQHLFLV